MGGTAERERVTVPRSDWLIQTGPSLIGCKLEGVIKKESGSPSFSQHICISQEQLRSSLERYSVSTKQFRGKSGLILLLCRDGNWLLMWLFLIILQDLNLPDER